MIHVFSNGLFLTRGDTFYIHVPSFKAQLYDLEILDWFNVINYTWEQTVPRLPCPVVYYQGDSIVPAIQQYQFEFPYALFTNDPDITEVHIDDPCLWHAKDRVVQSMSHSGATTLVPREAKADLKSQVYDYAYVQRKNKRNVHDKPLDIIFISNGEPDEELMFHHTEYMTNSDVTWIRGVNGRTAAYQAAARASTTPWFFAVFAKLEVLGGSFPWYDWQPDYWQEPKHYIFNARNPVNGLEYGHQGMIAYNKNLVLANNTPGIDFTLSQPHESVPILSGVARFNQDPWMTWRTAFREVVKLMHFDETQPTLETADRLHTWLTQANGDYAEWCLHGAQDAAEYYREVNGEYDKLMLSFDWPWLQARFNQRNTV
jgi:GMP synthase-like glutamine amidotransferase